MSRPILPPKNLANAALGEPKERPPRGRPGGLGGLKPKPYPGGLPGAFGKPKPKANLTLSPRGQALIARLVGK